jgi:hypothetical protein
MKLRGKDGYLNRDLELYWLPTLNLIRKLPRFGRRWTRNPHRRGFWTREFERALC